MVCCCKQKSAYEQRMSEWSSDGCSSGLQVGADRRQESLQTVHFCLLGSDAEGGHGAGKGGRLESRLRLTILLVLAYLSWTLSKISVWSAAWYLSHSASPHSPAPISFTIVVHLATLSVNIPTIVRKSVV